MERNKRLLLLLGALGLACLAAGVLETWPSVDEAAQRRLADVLKGGPRGDLPALFGRLYEQGDERGQCEVASLILAEPDPAPDVDRIVDLSVRDVWAWNTELPGWKVRVLKAWLNEHRMDGVPQGRKFFGMAPVEFSFAAAKPYRKLYIEGDWDERGELATVRGWNASPMTRRADGRWTWRRELRLTRMRSAYHAVVRTAPWPAGQAVGAAIFEVRRSRTVSVQALRESPEPALLTPASPHPTIDVAVLGIDGGSWRAVLPWVHEGYLPNFARLLQRGAAADEVASPEKDGYPSPANIYSAMTGKLRFRHGMDRGLGGDHFTTSLWRRASPVWKIASDRGLRTACIAMQGTFPPDVIEGDMVSEAYFAENANREHGAKAMLDDPSVVAFAQYFNVSAEQLKRLSLVLDVVQAVMATTSPHDLANELEKSVFLPYEREAGLAGLTLRWDKGITDAARHLVRGKYGLYCTYLTGVDAASHMYWEEIQPPNDGDGSFQAKRGHLFEAYRNADELLGILLDHSRSVVIFSDHGFGSLAHDVALPVINVPRLVSVISRELRRRIDPETAFYQTQRQGTLRQGWTLWLTAQAGMPLAGNLAELLSGMVYLPQGRPVFADVQVVSERGRVGVRFLEAPMLKSAESVRIGRGDHPVSDVLANVRLASTHMANGMFAMTGPQVRSGAISHRVKIVDVAPTVLYLAGLPLARDMDGRLTSEAWAPSYLAAHPPSYVTSYGSGGAGWLRLLCAIEWRKALGNLSRRFVQ